jgi:hypothetical protein
LILLAAENGAEESAPFFISCILPVTPVTNRHTENAVRRKHPVFDAVHRAMNSTINPRWRGASCAITTASLGGILLAGLALNGCARRPIVVHAPPATVVQSPAPATVIQNTPAPAPALAPTGRDVIVIKEAPPPPRQESPPPPPPSGSYEWVAGYWTVRDGRQEWIPGRYEMPPRTGATWVPPRWERRSDGYVFVEGYWR